MVNTSAQITILKPFDPSYIGSQPEGATFSVKKGLDGYSVRFIYPIQPGIELPVIQLWHIVDTQQPRRSRRQRKADRDYKDGFIDDSGLRYGIFLNTNL